jgi:FMN phosphatase YigB (HAD superfamily)
MVIKLIVFDYDDTINPPNYLKIFNILNEIEEWKNDVSEIFNFIEQKNIPIGLLTAGLYEKNNINKNFWFPENHKNLKYWKNRQDMSELIKKDFNHRTSDSCSNIKNENNILICENFKEWLKTEKIIKKIEEDYFYEELNSYCYQKIYTLNDFCVNENIERNQLLFIDDSPKNIYYANKAGFNTILCKHSHDILQIKNKIDF